MTTKFSKNKILLVSFVISIALIIILFSVYFFFRLELKSNIHITQFIIDNRFAISILSCCSLFINFLLHEFLHAVGWAFFCKKKFRSIIFGFDKNTLIFYCHCKEMLLRNQYGIGLMSPLITLGLLPFCISLYCNNFVIYLFASVNIVFCAGDIFIFSKLIKLQNHVRIIDSANEVGFTIEVE